jgi:uncharacterized phiE125 gp8 family phage protein
VTVEEARAWLRFDTSDEDAAIGLVVTSARQALEQTMRGHMISQRWRFVLDAWPRSRVLTLPLAPLQSIDTIRVYDSAGQPHLMTRDQFRLSRCTVVPRLKFDMDPPAPGITASGIEIDVTTGYGDAPDDVPGPMRQALRILLARWFDNRGDQDMGVLPGEVRALVAPFRQVRLA